MKPSVFSHPAHLVSAYQICFVSEAGDLTRVLIRFADPEPCLAIVESLSPENLLAAGSQTHSTADLSVLFLPSNASDLSDWQKRAEQWIAETSSGNIAPTVELQMKSGKILWRPGRAVVQAGGEYLNEWLIAMADFAFREGQLRKLEDPVRADLTAAPQDIPLTHAVSPADLKRQYHVNEMTSRNTLARLKFVQWGPRLENTSRLSGFSKLIISELLEKTRISDRLKALDDQLEVLQDLYESANDRLTEFRYFNEEVHLERWIIFLLWLEVVLLVLELLMSWIKGG